MKNRIFSTLAVFTAIVATAACSKEEGDRMERRVDETAAGFRNSVDRTADDIKSGARKAKREAKETTAELGHEIDQAVNRFTTPERNDVRRAQLRLERLGYNPGTADGVVGPTTSAAISQFQRDEKLDVTGRLDTGTVGRLEARVPSLAE